MSETAKAMQELQDVTTATGRNMLTAHAAQFAVSQASNLFSLGSSNSTIAVANAALQEINQGVLHFGGNIAASICMAMLGVVVPRAARGMR